MNKRLFILLAALIFSLFIGMNQKLYAQVLEQDSLALVALYDSTDGANWTDNTNWLTGPVSTWYGITVSGDRVARVALRSNNLVGTIPHEIGDLTNLTVLDLYTNQLTGSIPPEIGKLTSLTELNLHLNQLTGSIPPEIGNLTNLINWYMKSNQLTGHIPPEIGNLKNLRDLYLHTNQLDGPIPTEIGNLTNLINLDIHNNQLTDTISSEIGNLTDLTLLSLCNNQLSGSIPIEIGNLINLERFYLYNNHFTDLPDLSSDTSLTDLRIQENKFTFEDIEPNIFVTNFVYSPQDSVGEEQDTTIDQGSCLECSVTVGGTANQYQWMKDGLDIPGANSSSYIISSAESADEGSYICKITNTIATELTLYSRPVHVTVAGEVGVADYSIQILKVFALHQNYPNPFNPTTTITYSVPKDVYVNLKVFNLLGQEVETLVNKKMVAGTHRVIWNAQNVPSGVYFYKIEVGNLIKMNKMMLIK